MPFAASRRYTTLFLIAPALIALLYQVGRGAGNSGYLLYWLAALGLMLRRREAGFPAAAAGFFVVLVAWGTLSAALSIDARDSLEKWGQYALLGSGFFITHWWVRRVPDFNLDCALKLIGIIGLLSYAYYGGRFLMLASRPDFHPEFQVQGLIPAYLAPFSLYYLRQRLPSAGSMLLIAAYLTSLILLLLFSNSMTEVIAFVAAMVVLLILLTRNKRLLLSALATLFVLFVVMVLAFDKTGAILAHAANDNAIALLDKLTSYRTQLWRNALNLPPPNQWLGVGPANVGLYPPVEIHEQGGTIAKVRHLHNLLFDCWYEIGLVGLALYGLFYAAQLKLLLPGLSALTPAQRAVLWASIAAIAAASMLEQSYRSFHMAMFVPFLLALYGGAHSLALRPPSTAST